MKNLNELLSDVDESLLDDENKILKDAEKNIYYKKLKDVCDKYKYQIGCRDYFGRSLHVGDVVFAKTTKPHILVIEKLYNIGAMWFAEDATGRAFEAKYLILIPHNKLKDFLEIITYNLY